MLFTCFGPHEARMEESMFRALHANFTKHVESGFGHVIEPDKPLSVCNSLYTWACGSSLSDAQLEQEAAPFLDAQLRAADLFVFVKEARSHATILADPEGSAHSGWAEMYDGRFVPCLKQALEEDDDGRGGVQTIVRCSMKAVASACRSSEDAAAVMLDLGALDLLRGFETWARRDHWTPHAWMREEVLERVEEVRELLQARQGCASGGSCREEPFFGSFNVRLTGAPVRLHERPDPGAPVVAEVGAGRTLQLRARRGLWLRVALHEADAWLLAYCGGQCVGCLVDWEIRAWEP